MRFLLDESAEPRIAAFLKQAGHDVTSIAEDYPRSIRDEQVLAIANAEQRILITNDRDFGELIFRQQLSHQGVIYFRLPLDSTAQEKITRLTRLLRLHPVQEDSVQELLSQCCPAVAPLPAGSPLGPELSTHRVSGPPRGMTPTRCPEPG